jgi:hypothetical protein
VIPRSTVLAAGLAALALPLPAATVLGVALTLTGLIALGLSVVRPGSAAPAVLIAAAALSWLSTPAGHGHAVRLVALAFALAVVHSSAALAAVLPARAAVPAGLLLRWAGWTAAATALGAGLVAGIPAVVAAAPPGWTSVAAVLGIGALAVRVTAAARRSGERPGGSGDEARGEQVQVRR